MNVGRSDGEQQLAGLARAGLERGLDRQRERLDRSARVIERGDHQVADGELEPIVARGDGRRQHQLDVDVGRARVEHRSECSQRRDR